MSSSQTSTTIPFGAIHARALPTIEEFSINLDHRVPGAFSLYHQWIENGVEESVSKQELVHFLLACQKHWKAMAGHDSLGIRLHFTRLKDEARIVHREMGRRRRENTGGSKRREKRRRNIAGDDGWVHEFAQ